MATTYVITDAHFYFETPAILKIRDRLLYRITKTIEDI